jgi:hypothetical protein
MEKERIRALIVEAGADQAAHRRGSLLAHLERTADWAERWQCSAELVTAALCHAVYGTDGLVGPLVGLDQRDRVRAVAGDQAERIVYRYASCDREFVYPQLEAAVAEVVFRDRFTGWSGLLTAAEWADFMTLTWANSADVIETSGDLDWSGALPFLAATAALVPDGARVDLCRLLNAVAVPVPVPATEAGAGR